MDSLRLGLTGFFGSIFQLLRSGRSGNQKRCLLFVFFYSVIANLPYWLASWAFGFADHRGLFCEQFLTVGLIALFAPPLLSAILLLVVMSADLISVACDSYFLSIHEFLANIGVFESFTGPRRAAAVAVILLALLVAAGSIAVRAVTVRKDCRWCVAACLVAFGVFILLTDAVSIRRNTGHFPTLLHAAARADASYTNRFNVPRLARISIPRLIRAEIADARLHAQGREGSALPIPVPSATAEALRALDLAPGTGSQDLPNVVMVMVESWGLANDVPLQQALVQPYLQPDLRGRYQVLQGTVPFNGATLPGEARELCGNSLGYGLVYASAKQVRGCLPDRLAALGYHNIALHGMDGSMFRRSTWYQTIGFDEQWFNGDFKQQGLPDCVGAFLGTCDADIAGWLEKRLEQDSPHPQFVHWMTLSSHLPVLVPAHLSNGAACSASISLEPQSALCSWYQLVANVHQSVSRLAMGNLARSTVFVIVGDHAPPFSNPALRSRFSETVVPYVILIPRSHYRFSDRMMAHTSLALSAKAAKSNAQTP